jgi:hypothetical protein
MLHNAARKVIDDFNFFVPVNKKSARHRFRFISTGKADAQIAMVQPNTKDSVLGLWYLHALHPFRRGARATPLLGGRRCLSVISQVTMKIVYPLLAVIASVAPTIPNQRLYTARTKTVAASHAG